MQSPSRVELVYASGQVRVQKQSAKVGDLLLAEGDSVEVGKGSCCLAIDPGINLCLADHSRLRIARVGTAAQQVELLAGRVTASLDPQPRGTSFSVLANGSQVTAIGTVFSVEMTNEQKEVEAVVLSGKVAVSGKVGKRLLRAHQRAVVKNSRTEVENVVRSSESRLWSLVSHTDLWKGPATSVLDLSAAPAGAEVFLNGRIIGRAPLSSLIPAGRHRLELRLGGAPVLKRSLVVEAGKTALKDIDLTPLLQPATGTPEPEPVEQPAHSDVEPRQGGKAPSGEATASRLMSVARRLMQQGRWAEASFAYREIRQAYPDSPEARTVLVPLGQLELDHLYHAAAARELFELYLQQGGGPLAQEASYSLVRALRELGQSQQERAAIERFLQRYPSSFEAPVLKRRLRELGGNLPEPEGERTDVIQ